MSLTPNEQQPSSQAAPVGPPASEPRPLSPDAARTTLWQTGPPPPPVSRTPRSATRLRWFAALAATILVVAGATGLVMLATASRTSAALGPTFLPEGSVAYLEARLDLPGDQREKVVDLISRFPGFADRAAFDGKVDEALDEWMRGATGGLVSWRNDIEPWFGGQIAVGMTEIPDTAAMEDATRPPPGLLAFSVSDRAALEASIADLRLLVQGAEFVEEAYNGRTIVRTSHEGTDVAWVVTDQLWIVGTRVEDVRTAIDVLAGTRPSLAASEPFQSSAAKLPADRLGAMYLDMRGFKDLIDERSEAVPGMGEALEQLPQTFIGAIRAESDRAFMEFRVLASDATPIPPVRATSLAERVPFDAPFYLEVRDVGKTLQQMISQLTESGAVPLDDSANRQVEEFLGAPLDEFLEWVEDVGVTADVRDDEVTAGIVATVTDEATAVRRLESLATAIRAAVAFGVDVPLEFDESEHGGTTVTTFRVTPSAGIPEDVPIEPSISYAISDGRFYLGLGSFVEDALDRQATDSLSANPRFTEALTAAGGASNAGLVYLDIERVRTLVEGLMSAEDRARYEQEAKPYLEPLDRLLAVYVVEGQEIVGRTLLYVE